MKYIFDFYDVLFHTTKHRKEHMFLRLQKAGVPRVKIDEYYEIAREHRFSLKKLLAHFSLKQDIYEEIMSKAVNFINVELLELIKKIGKENCYIVTYGDDEFNKDKIKRSGMIPMFSEIIVTPDSLSKKETIEKICAKHKDEKVIFVDDKIKYLADLDLKKYPNLKTILYIGQNTASLIEEIEK